MIRILIILIITILVSIWTVCKIIAWMYIFCNNPLSYIVITGNRQLTTNHDIQTLIEKFGAWDTFIMQDVNAVHRCIIQLPWIKKVSIRKQWPDILKIHLIEYIPQAYWNDDYIISNEGTIFKNFQYQKINSNDHDDVYMPMLYGPEDKAQAVLYNYLIFKKILKSSELRIKSLKMNSCYSWQLVLQDDICLKLSKNNMIDQLLCFVKVYPVVLQKIKEKNKHIDYIDLRYRSGIAIKWVDNSVISDV